LTDLYETLGVARDATRDAVRGAFKRKAKRAHPDAGGSVEAFGALVRARDVLCDDERRAKYDRTGEAEDGPIADNLEANALDWAQKKVDEAIQGIVNRGYDPARQDILDVARRSVRADLDRNASMQRQLREGAGKYRALAKRFKKKGGGDNRLRKLMEGKALDLERGAERNEDLAQPLKRALEILADYALEWERPAPQPGMGGMFFTTTGVV
jgi:curved DNA-binding protein CbpA